MVEDNVYSLIDLSFLNAEEREPYIEGVLYEGQMAGLIGQQKAGKSYLIDQLSVYLAEGKDWAGGRFVIPKPRSVLVVQTEGGAMDLAERVNPVRDKIKAKGLKWASWIPEELDLNKGVGLVELERLIKDFEVEILCIDSLYTSMTGSTSNESDVGQVFMNLRRLQVRYPGLSIIFLHHEHRARTDSEGTQESVKNRYSGSWMIMAKVDISWHFVFDENQHGDKREFSVANARSRVAGIDPFFVDMDYETGELIADDFQLTEGITQLRLHIKGQGFISNRDLNTWIKERKYARSTGFRWVATMEQAGDIRKAVREIEGEPEVLGSREVKGREWIK